MTVLACQVSSLAWSSGPSFAIADFSYQIGDTALLTGASAATQTNACDYQVTYSLSDTSIFSFDDTTYQITTSTSDYSLKGTTKSVVLTATVTDDFTGNDITLSSNSFTVSLTCDLTSYTAVTITDQTYTVGDAGLTISVPAFTQVPACGWTETITTVTTDGVDSIITVSDSANTITVHTIDRSFATSPSFYTITVTRTVNSAPPATAVTTFSLTIEDPCESTALTDQTLTTMTVDLMSTSDTQTFTTWPDSVGTA